MYSAQAVLKTSSKDQFNSAGFEITVKMTPVSDTVLPESMSEMYRYIQEGWCDGFIIDLGDNKKKHIIKTD
jgi:hypothetical protein